MYRLRNKIFIGLLLITLVSISITVKGYTENNVGEFSDITQEDWFYTYISWAIENEILEGYPDGTIRPTHNVSEAEFLAMLFRLAPQESVQFNIERHGGDVWKRRINTSMDKINTPIEEGEYWATNIYQASHTLNMNIKESDEKNKALTRGEVARILVKFLTSQTMSELDAVAYLLDSDLSTGKTEKTYEGYAPDETLTRAETVTFLERLTAPVKRPIISQVLAIKYR